MLPQLPSPSHQPQVALRRDASCLLLSSESTCRDTVADYENEFRQVLVSFNPSTAQRETRDLVEIAAHESLSVLVEQETSCRLAMLYQFYAGKDRILMG
ncbi:hypothetical protein DIPPA_19256 [Diplonema papillatum]|nr:hypothetical protein DIPPA_19256 [Diplonema papillatum]